MKLTSSFFTTRAGLACLALGLILLIALLRYLLSDELQATSDQGPATPARPALATNRTTPAPHSASTSPAKPKEAAFLNDAMCKEMALGLEMGPGHDPAQLGEQWKQAENRARVEAEKMIEQAINSADLQQRAAALFMQAGILAQKIPLEFKQKYPKCVENPTCLQQMEAATTAARTKNFNEIAKMAINSRDPQLYATAFHACHALQLAGERVESSEGFCQQISASQWALRDPDNGFAWLYVAKQDGNKNAGVDNAMSHLSRAKIFDQRLLGLPQLQTSFKLAQQNGFVQLELATLNQATHRLRASPSTKLVTDYCQPEHFSLANRRQLCNDIAERLLNDQNNVITFLAADQIGKNLGWPATKTAAARLEQDAISGWVDEVIKARSKKADAAPDKTIQSCQDSARGAKITLNMMEYGEMGQWRKELANQPLSNAELAARYRAELAKENSPPWRIR